MKASPPPFLRRMARIFMRGPDVPFILADLEETYYRDLERGFASSRARARYLRNVFGSILHTWRSNPWTPSWAPSRIDLKLGLRMLVRHPGLTLVAVFALTVGIPVGLLPFHALDSFQRPMPVPGGDEIVMLRNWDLVQSRRVTRPIHDFDQWRRELKSFEEIGWVRTDPYNVLSDDGWVAPVRGAELTASVFSILRVQPYLGRYLDESDERPGAPDVVVISHDFWQSRLGGAPRVVGDTIRIGNAPHTIIGIMPEGFLFPYRDHLWFPLRANPLDYEPGGGPDGWIMARLAAGVSTEEARTEIELMGQRMAQDYPETHAHLQPQILPYAQGLMGLDPGESTEALVIQFLAVLLLILACGNVGILILARSATRTREIAIRTALGASRTRVVGQLFLESLILAIVAAGLGLVLGQMVATSFRELSHELPFWINFDIRPKTVLVALLLASASAAVAGVIPALKATGKKVLTSAQRGTGGRSGIRFGMASSVLVVAEVAVGVWFLTLGAVMLPASVPKAEGLGIETGQYLQAFLRIPWVDPRAGRIESYQKEFRDRIRIAHEELKERVAADPATGAAAIADILPGMAHPARLIEVEGEPRDSVAHGIRVHMARVDIDYFDALEQPILNGRGFRPSDVREGGTVIVNTSFVNRILGGRNPVGRRIRYAARDGQPGAWHEIVGVVGSLGMNPLNPATDAGVYYPVAPGDLHPLRFAIRVGDDPEAFTQRLREIAREIDPAAMIQNPTALNEVFNPDHFAAKWVTLLMVLLAGIAITLSASGLYALVAFTVSERTHEIGIRAALGAQPGRIVAAIARRASYQLLTGVILGFGLCVLTLPRLKDDLILSASQWPIIAALIALAVVGVGFLACLPPTRRGLRIQPVEALRELP